MERSPKKLVLFTSLPKVGGHSTLTLGLCRLLRPHFSSIEIWCKVMPGHGHSEALAERLEELGCRVRMLSDLQGKLIPSRVARFFLSSLRRRPDVFFTLAMRHLSPLLAVISLARLRLYYQITHDLKPGTIRMLRAYARLFSRIVFICPATFEEFPGAAENRNTYSWIPQSSEIPVSGREQLRDEREALTAGAPPIRFGIIGRLTVEKGAEVMRQFAQTGGVECEIHVAGSGPLEPAFRELAARPDRPGLPKVRFHGAFDPSQREAFLRTFFRGIDYLVVPSQDEWETLSMAALEALQHGVPSVICRTGGLKSFAHPELGPAPDPVIRLVEPEALPSTLAALSKDPRPSWDSTGVLCLAHYDRYFSDHAILNRWLEVLLK